MNHPSCNIFRISLLALGLLLFNLGLPPEAQAGKRTSGGASGVTSGGSVPLPIGGSPITPQSTTPTSPNVALDPNTGSLLLTAEAQSSLNQAAEQVLQRLEADNPGLLAALSDPLDVDLDERIEGLALAVRGVADGEPQPKASLREAATDASTAIQNYRWAELYIDQEILELTAPLQVLGSEGEFSMVAIYTSLEGGESTSLLLRGTLEELGNATSFLIITAGSGIDPVTIAPFVAMAAKGAPYPQLLDLLIAVNELAVANAAGEDIDPNALNRAIYAYRSIVNTVDQSTLNSLGNTPDFTNLRQALQNLRDAIDT